MDHVETARRLLDESNQVPAENIEQAGRDAITAASVHAQLAIAEKLEALTEAVYNCLGDGSNLDRIRQALEQRNRGEVA